LTTSTLRATGFTMKTIRACTNSVRRRLGKACLAIARLVHSSDPDTSPQFVWLQHLCFPKRSRTPTQQPRTKPWTPWLLSKPRLLSSMWHGGGDWGEKGWERDGRCREGRKEHSIIACNYSELTVNPSFPRPVRPPVFLLQECR